MAGCPYLHIGGLRVRSGDAVVELNGAKLRVVHGSKGRSRLDRPSFFPPSDGEITVRDLKAALAANGQVEIDTVVFTSHGSFSTPLDPANAQGRKGREQDTFATLCSLNPAQRRAAALYQLSTLPDSDKSSAEATRERVRAIESFLTAEDVANHADSRFGTFASDEMVARIIASKGVSLTAEMRVVGKRWNEERLDTLYSDIYLMDSSDAAEVIEALSARVDTSRLVELALAQPSAVLASPTAVHRLDPTTLEHVKRKSLSDNFWSSDLPYSLDDVPYRLEERAPEITELAKRQRVAPGVFPADEIRDLQQRVVTRATAPDSGAYGADLIEQTANGTIRGVIEQMSTAALNALLAQQVTALTGLGKRYAESLHHHPPQASIDRHVNKSMNRLEAAVDVQHLLTPEWRAFLQERYPERYNEAVLRRFCENPTPEAAGDARSRAAANPSVLFANEKLVSLFSKDEIHALALAHPDEVLAHAPELVPQSALAEMAERNPARVMEVLGGALSPEQRAAIAQSLTLQQRADLAPDTIDVHHLVLDLLSDTGLEDPRPFTKLLERAPELFTQQQLQLLRLEKRYNERTIEAAEARRAEITAAATRKAR
jgi:hypothetical protein